MSRRVGSIDIHKKVLMVVVATTAAAEAGEDATGQAMEFENRRFGTGPWCLILGVFVGASAGFYSMYRQLMADVEREEREKGS